MAEATYSVGSHCVTIRELHSGGTGVRLYETTRLLLDRLPGLRDWSGTHVVELGAGTGIISIALAKLGAHVYTTDYQGEGNSVLKNLRYNVHQNGVSKHVKVLNWDWAVEPPQDIPLDRLDCCVGSEIIYGVGGDAVKLCKAVGSLKARAPKIEVYFGLQQRELNTVKLFVDECQRMGWSVVKENLALPDVAGGEAEATVEKEEQESLKQLESPGAKVLLRL
eukprot:gnl/TRDRNA2_/TRDRNA2_167940_c0_seq2.p1 gnl/TRDRNA2_/TRDRNA2_167940_c0~~gnl/TRDRNA2_/TRDRNA2_167940_c0_seq2.p1  ORF type:complete len:222 (+),score=37.70 gnl/TRDRNA2_/TRDRNA2_167940_c0_seq2:60-725(+)